MMESATQVDTTSHNTFVGVGTTALNFILTLSKGIFQLGQTVRLWVEDIHKFSEALQIIRTQSEEIAQLKQQIQILNESSTIIDDVKVQLSAHHCKLVLLENRHRMTQRKSY
jgi:hypothetical protein